MSSSCLVKVRMPDLHLYCHPSFLLPDLAQYLDNSWNKQCETSSKRKGHSVEINIKNMSVACTIKLPLSCSVSGKGY